MVQGRIILNLPIGKICGFSRLAFLRVGSWRKTAFAAPASCGSGGAAGSNPLSLAALASSPKGTPLGDAGKLAATTEAVPLGKVAANAVSRRKGYLQLPSQAQSRKGYAHFPTKSGLIGGAK